MGHRRTTRRRHPSTDTYIKSPGTGARKRVTTKDATSERSVVGLSICGNVAGIGVQLGEAAVEAAMGFELALASRHTPVEPSTVVSWQGRKRYTFGGANHRGSRATFTAGDWARGRQEARTGQSLGSIHSWTMNRSSTKARRPASTQEVQALHIAQKSRRTGSSSCRMSPRPCAACCVDFRGPCTNIPIRPRRQG